MNEEQVERVAKAAAYSVRQPNDASADADEYWAHTGSLGQHTWRVAVTAAIAAMPDTSALKSAIMPFSDAVYNDNGDVTIDTSHIRQRDWINARIAVRAIAGEDKSDA